MQHPSHDDIQSHTTQIPTQYPTTHDTVPNSETPQHLPPHLTANPVALCMHNIYTSTTLGRIQKQRRPREDSTSVTRCIDCYLFPGVSTLLRSSWAKILNIVFLANDKEV